MNQNIIDAMADLKEDQLFEAVEKAVAAKESPEEILDALQAGLDIVGDRYSAQVYFLSELMLSAELFNEASGMLDQDAVESVEKLGTFLIGTVETDVHDIGKNIVVSILKSKGFEVIDLGIDVPVRRFVEAVRENEPQLIGLSCLLTTCFDKMKETVEAIRDAGLDENRLILVGGGPVDQKTVDWAGADRYCETAQDAVKVAKDFLGVC